MRTSVASWLSTATLAGINVYAFRDSLAALLVGVAIGYVVCYDLVRRALHER